jgi:hypothetical protein
MLQVMLNFHLKYFLTIVTFVAEDTGFVFQYLRLSLAKQGPQFATVN